MHCLQPELSTALGRPVNVELMPGDLGTKAAKMAIASSADGNTILVATFGTHAISPDLKPNLGYDPQKDFTPVCLATRSPLILGPHPSFGAHDVKALIALASKSEVPVGSSGVGSAPYLAGLLFQKMSGVRLTHRAYPDPRMLYEDLLAQRLDISFNNASSMLPLVREKRLRALAVTTPVRCTAAPALPTMMEEGLDGFSLNNWLGFVAPPRTPAPIVAELNTALLVALRSPRAHSFFTTSGIDVIGSTPYAFRSYIAEEIDRWSWLRDSPHA